MLQLDHWLFSHLNALAGRWPWLDGLARLFLNDYFVPTLLAVLLAALWFEGRSKAEQAINQRAVLVATLSTIVGNILVKGCNLLYFRPRPFAEFEVNLLFYQPTDSSWPSNAAVIGFAIAFGVWRYNRCWGWPMLAIAFLFGFSRIFGGVHYPLDVLSGAMLAGVAVWLMVQQERAVAWLLQRLGGVVDKLGIG